MQNNRNNIQVDANNLWQIAQRQISRLRPQKQVLIQASQSKSLQSVFNNINKQSLQSLMPKGLYNIKQTKNGVPKSVAFLDFYAQKMGFLPMGSIYQSRGDKYIGRIQQVSRAGQKFYKPFPKFGIQSAIETPNLTQNLSFKATNAIQKWNQFIRAQAQLAQFIQKASTSQGRKQMILQYAKACSLGTDMLKILSSLFFLYLDQKSSNSNYFQITRPQELKQILLNQGTLKDIYDTACQLIQNTSKANVSILKSFHNYKVQSIRASLTQQEYALIQSYIDDKLAYVPNQMIKQTFLDNSQWFQVLTKNQSKSKSRLVTQKWPVKQPWFKPINYLDK